MILSENEDIFTEYKPALQEATKYVQYTWQCTATNIEYYVLKERPTRNRLFFYQ